MDNNTLQKPSGNNDKKDKILPYSEEYYKNIDTILSNWDIFISKIPDSEYTIHDHVYINLWWYIVSEENYEINLTRVLPLWLNFDWEKITWIPKEIWNFEMSIELVDSDWNTRWIQSFNLKIDDINPDLIY